MCECLDQKYRERERERERKLILVVLARVLRCGLLEDEVSAREEEGEGVVVVAFLEEVGGEEGEEGQRTVGRRKVL